MGSKLATSQIQKSRSSSLVVKAAVGDKEVTAIKQTGNTSKYLALLGLKHKCRGFDYQGVEIIQVTREDLLAVAASLYTDGWNYLRNQVRLTTIRCVTLRSENNKTLTPLGVSH